MPEETTRLGQIPKTKRINARIMGTGECVPEITVTNDDLSEVLDTSDDWIRPRTGIEERKYASPEESLPVMLSVAAIEAMRNARVDPEEIGLIIAAHNATDELSVPPVSTRVQYIVGAKNAACADVEAGCSGAIMGTQFALKEIRHDHHYAKKRNLKVLQVSGDVLTNRTPMEDRRSAVVLADGAGAMVLGPEYENDLGIQHVINRADGGKGYLINYGVRAYNQLAGTHPLRFERPEGNPHKPFTMDGGEVHNFIGTKAPGLVRDLLTEQGWDLSELENFLVVPHQMNLRSIDLARRRLKRELGYEPREIYVEGVIHDGNNSTASIPIGFHRLHKRRRLELYDPIMGIAFGAGLTWGGFVGTWNLPQPALEISQTERKKVFEYALNKYAQFQHEVERIRSL